MKANELMIGAFVYFNCFDGSKIVVCVTGFKDGIVYGDSKNGSHWCNIEKVEPIPLTQEILEKNGYKKDGYIYRHEELGRMQLGELFEDASIDFDKNGINYRIQTSPRYLQYVHQLQHALRLCGIEKEIIL